VLCQLRLGLKALALAWLGMALAFRHCELGPMKGLRPGLAWLWPGLGLLSGDWE